MRDRGLSVAIASSMMTIIWGFTNSWDKLGDVPDPFLRGANWGTEQGKVGPTFSRGWSLPSPVTLSLAPPTLLRERPACHRGELCWCESAWWRTGRGGSPRTELGWEVFLLPGCRQWPQLPPCPPCWPPRRTCGWSLIQRGPWLVIFQKDLLWPGWRCLSSRGTLTGNWARTWSPVWISGDALPRPSPPCWAGWSIPERSLSSAAFLPKRQNTGGDHRSWTHTLNVQCYLLSDSWRQQFNINFFSPLKCTQVLSEKTKTSCAATPPLFSCLLLTDASWLNLSMCILHSFASFPQQGGIS